MRHSVEQSEPEVAAAAPHMGHNGPPRITADLIPEAALAAEFDDSVRTWQRRRKDRSGPPFIVIGKSVYYRRTTVLAWLASLETGGEPKSRRAGRNRAA